MKDILNPGFDLTLRPMKYPQLFDQYLDAIKNTWTVAEINFNDDLTDLRLSLSSAERHLVNRLVAFFATGDSIVANNLVLNLYKHINSPEGRMYLGRQLAEECTHTEFYLTLLDNYIPDMGERERAFDAITNIPSIKQKADFCFKWMNMSERPLMTDEDKKRFILNLITFACAVEGLFFFSAFAYVFFLRSKGLLNGMADGTNWTMRDESCLRKGTEVLTTLGWKKFEDLTGDESVAQFDLETESIDFVKPTRIVQKRFTGNLKTFSMNRFHQAVTPDHDMVWKLDSQPAWRKHQAQEFKNHANRVMPTAGFSVGQIKSLSWHEKFWIALQADGSVDNRSAQPGLHSGCRVVNFTFKRPRKIERFDEILQNCGFEHTKSLSTRPGTYIYRVKVPVDIGCYKAFDEWVTLEDKNHTWCEEFLEELAEWDGHRVVDRRSKERLGSINYGSVNPDNLSVVASVAALCGRSVHIGERVKMREDGTQYETLYVASITKKNTVRCGSSMMYGEEPYDDTVYCVTVPKGAIVVRSNNKVSITGNCHMRFAMTIVDIVRSENPQLFDRDLGEQVRDMMIDAVECEYQFAADVLSEGVTGLSLADMHQYLKFTADQRMLDLGLPAIYGGQTNPFPFMELQNVQTFANFFERTVSEYQIGVSGAVDLTEDF